MNSLSQWSLWFGIAFIAIGILGFIPGITTADNHLLGIFEVNTVHNLVHIVSGAAAIWAATAGEKQSRMYFQIFGLIYAVVAIMGFLSGTGYVLGVISNNSADTLLHLAIAAVALYLGFMNTTRTGEPAPPPS